MVGTIRSCRFLWSLAMPTKYGAASTCDLWLCQRAVWRSGRRGLSPTPDLAPEQAPAAVPRLSRQIYRPVQHNVYVMPCITFCRPPRLQRHLQAPGSAGTVRAEGPARPFRARSAFAVMKRWTAAGARPGPSLGRRPGSLAPMLAGLSAASRRRGSRAHARVAARTSQPVRPRARTQRSLHRLRSSGGA